MEQFKIPIVLICFKRVEKTIEVLRKIAQVRPRKLYILSDEGRNEEEKLRVKQCRQSIETAIDWPCEIVKNYAQENRDCYENIGLGAKWVFSREERAIFLEDDNLPELSFFKFCEEMLERYADDARILWICGTNYLEKYIPPDGSDYVFTKHMLPCGWASWGSKFLSFYDSDYSLYNEYVLKRLKHEYSNMELYKFDLARWKGDVSRKMNGGKFISWDYQMGFSLRVHGMYGIAPKNNLIKNIGIDNDAAHGSSSFEDIMAQRFCGIDSFPMTFPLKHPRTVMITSDFEEKITNIVIPPRMSYTEGIVSRIAKKFLRMKKRMGDNK